MFDSMGYLCIGEVPGWQGFIIDIANYLRINFYQDDMTPAAPIRMSLLQDDVELSASARVDILQKDDTISTSGRKNIKQKDN